MLWIHKQLKAWSKGLFSQGKEIIEDVPPPSSFTCATHHIHKGSEEENEWGNCKDFRWRRIT